LREQPNSFRGVSAAYRDSSSVRDACTDLVSGKDLGDRKVRWAKPEDGSTGADAKYKLPAVLREKQDLSLFGVRDADDCSNIGRRASREDCGGDRGSLTK
jgi:hypothetical protein